MNDSINFRITAMNDRLTTMNDNIIQAVYSSPYYDELVDHAVRINVWPGSSDRNNFASGTVIYLEEGLFKGW